ncbi:MAG TPA: triose-phosphate isomerase [Candidatus Dormibacteraeota bacterium]|nr:triose-phosphate isomerase [Candidatus Dormibacteraeota bacterium]
MPTTLIAGNWKMHKTIAETRAFLAAFLERVPHLPADVAIAIAPPFTALSAAREALAGQARVTLAAQTMHWEPSGAYTGEISAPMLAELGVRYVIVGHSERRMYCGETDRTVNLKTQAALEHGITPIVAVGESLEVREAGGTDALVVAQVRAALHGIPPADLQRIVIAYEPIWAIGTGLNCDAAQADRVMGLIRTALPGLAETSLLYGGSMKPDNAAAYLERPNINGGLIGGASLDPYAFADLVQNASLI